MARHVTASQEALSPSDVLQRMLRPEGPFSIFDAAVAVSSDAFAATDSHVFPCRYYSAVTLLVSMTFLDDQSSLVLRPELSYEDISYGENNATYPQAEFDAKFDAGKFYIPIERTQAGAGNPIGKDVEIYLGGVSGGATMQRTITFLTRGARQFRISYRRTGSSTVTINQINAMLHQGSWMGWA